MRPLPGRWTMLGPGGSPLAPMPGPGGAPLTTEQCLLGLRQAVLGSTPDGRQPLGELGDAAPATRRRRSEEERERVRLAGLSKEQVVEELLAVKNAEKKAKRRKKQQSSESACELLRRLGDLGTPIIRAAPPRSASAEDKASYARMKTLTADFFRMRKDEGLAARDGTNEGCRWNAVKVDITAFVDFVAGGIIGHEFEMRGIERVKAAPIEIIREQVFHPSAFSDGGLDCIGRCIKMPRGRGMARGMVPSSTCVSDTRVALIKHLSQFFDLHVDRYGWRYTKLKSMLVPLLKHWRAHEKFGNEPMDLKAWIDGAPTMKLKSRVAFLLHFIDPRLHPGIHTFPQSRDWHHLVAEYFGSEDAASLRSNFEALIAELRQLGEHGLTYELDDGSSVTVLFNVIHCPDMKARWALAKRCEVAPDSDDEEGLAEEEHGSLPESRPVGGGITQSTWPCDLGPLHESNRARGPGGGCRACRAERAAAGTPCLPGRLVASESDLHFWVDQPAADGFKLRACMHCDPFDESDGRREFAAERDARLARMTTESANPNLSPLHRVPPLLANKAARVREVHARLPHLAVTVLEKKKVDELNAMMGAHCSAEIKHSFWTPKWVIN